MTTEERLHNLEKALKASRRYNRLLFIGVAAAVALPFLLGAITGIVHPEVRANKFVLVDSEGRTRANLHMLRGEQPELALYDRNGVDRAGICFNPDGTPAVYIFDPSRSRGAGLGFGSDDQPRVRIRSERSAMLYAHALEYLDAAGRAQACIGVTSEGNAALLLTAGEEGDGNEAMLIASKENTRLWLENGDGAVLFEPDGVGAGLSVYKRIGGKLRRQDMPAQANDGSGRAYGAVVAEYEQALAAWEAAMRDCDNVGLNTNAINNAAAGSNWSAFLGTLGSLAKQDAARKLQVARERLDRAKAKLQALEWK